MSIEPSKHGDRIVVGSVREVIGIICAIAALVVALISICGAVGSAAVAYYRVGMAETSNIQTNARVSILERDSAEKGAVLARIDERTKRIEESIRQ